MNNTAPTVEQIFSIAELLEEIHQFIINHGELTAEIQGIRNDILMHCSLFRGNLKEKIQKAKQKVESCFTLLCMKACLELDDVDFSKPTFFSCISRTGVQELGPASFSKQELLNVRCSCPDCSAARQLIAASEKLMLQMECFENNISACQVATVCPSV